MTRSSRFVRLFSGTLLLAGAALLALTPLASPRQNVLYIGNSLIASNTLPHLVFEMARSQGQRTAYTQHTPGGARLADHATHAGLRAAIRDTAWDLVVIQEQSQYSGFSDRQVERDVLPFAAQIIRDVRSHNPAARIVLYQTMAHKDGDQQNKRVVPGVGTYAGMQRRINRTYDTIAMRNGASVAPVGTAWMTFRTRHPDLELYRDDRHPNPLGSYLVACVLFAVLFERPCASTPLPEGLDLPAARAAQSVADQTVAEHRGP
ncbi:MAG: SGNH/GDSL hydrolase family protein [Pseudomonadota bacterium]